MSEVNQARSLQVLHITNWYPTAVNPLDGIWIKRQIESLPSQVSCDVYHIQVEFGRNLRFLKASVPGIRMQIPVKSWLLNEIISCLLIVYTLMFKTKLKRYDVVNFHIAYPLCVFLSFIQLFLRKPVVINEHWSAYHLNFGIKDPAKLSRIKSIFKPNIKIITVSQALARDIRKFAGKQDLNIDIVPNVVDIQVFQFKPVSHNGLLMAGYWKYPKDPIRVLKAFSKVCEEFPEASLRIAGQGPLLDTMKTFSEESGLKNRIIWLGHLEESELALEMQQAQALVHISRYETFSVVCAEAICCGTPVIASAVGGITEFINEGNGQLIIDDGLKSLIGAMKNVLINDHFDRASIANAAAQRFDSKAVGQLYYKSLIRSCAA